MIFKYAFVNAIVFSAFMSATCFAEPSAIDKKLAAESEASCAKTSKDKASPELIEKKVSEAVVMLEKSGSKSFSKFKGDGSTFLFAGTYIWINDLNGKMLMHPIKPGMEGQDLIGLKDSNGKRFFVEMIDKVKTKGDGWVSYTWPKPGEKERSLKVSYVKKVVFDGVSALVGCGTYDLTEDEVKKLENK